MRFAFCYVSIVDVSNPAKDTSRQGVPHSKLIGVPVRVTATVVVRASRFMSLGHSEIEFRALSFPFGSTATPNPPLARSLEKFAGHTPDIKFRILVTGRIAP